MADLDMLDVQTRPEVVMAEHAVIAACLLDSRVIRFAVDEVTGADFSDGGTGNLFDRIVAMAGSGAPVDVVTVSARMREWGILRPSPEDLHRWISDVPTAANVGWYAEQVRRDSVRREVTRAALSMTQLAAAREADPGVIIEDSLSRLRDLQRSGTRTRWSGTRLGDILTMPDEPYDWLVEGMLERGDRVILTGAEGAGKTTLVRQMAIRMAAGVHPFSVRPIDPVRVLVVDAENTARQWRRETESIEQEAARRGVGDARLMRVECVNRLDLTTDGDLGQVHKLIDEEQPDVLCIGPLYRLIPRAVNSDDDAAPLLAALDTLRARGCALIIEAHAGHGESGDRAGYRPRGSSALLGWPEFGFGLRAERDTAGYFELVRWRGERDAKRVWPVRLVRGPEGWPWQVTEW